MNKLLIACLTAILFWALPSHGQLISDPQRLQDIQRMLKVQQQLTSNSSTGIWKYLQKKMPADEKQAIHFLYAYMPLSDMADYQPSFIHENVKQALKARSEMTWGKQISEDVFLHFVLPLRVNNENLDSFRMVMYPVLKARIKGLSMKEAALEINHWCHEKVAYRGTDERTSAPLSTVKKTFGRCGEESTFTVTALRTAGIPARQVYTPRWAHSDDNHAWVEVWIDGKWYYLGACEPESDLNIGWFSEPARRAMLVHTRAFGHYYGKEQVVIANDRFSELNLTGNYAPVKKVIVKVKNSDGTPADSAKVEFKLYNYAEFYPIATNYTDKQGCTQLTTGMGDLLVWASRSGKFAYVKLSVPETDSLELTLNKTSVQGFTDKYYMVPPHAAKVELNVSEEQKRINNQRLHSEDSIRNAYMATFKDSVWAKSLANRLNLSPDTVKEFIRKSYGNWNEVASYLEKNAAIAPAYTLAMATQLSDKDFSDLKEPILTDHLRYAIQTKDHLAEIGNEQFIKYVLSPRISYENLTAWRSFLAKRFGESMAAKAKKDISVLTDWIRTHISIDDMANMHSRSPISPAGVYNLRVADRISRNIFFVAACRTFGILARLNPETQEPEYMRNGDWLRAGFTPDVASQPAKGKLHLVNGDNPVVPQYFLHFTIGVLHKGTYHTLGFDENKKVTDFPETTLLDAGHYVLITGNRLQDGSVLSSLTYFEIKANEETTVKVEMSREPGELKSSGKIDLNKLQLQLLNSTASATLDSLAGGEKIVLVLLDPDKEPSKHILNDLGPYTDLFNKWNGKFIFAMPAEKSGQAKVISSYSLPEKRYSGIDVSDNILTAISLQYGEGLKDKLPLVLFCDEKGNIYFFSSGYKIGIGEQLLRVKGQLETSVACGAVKTSCNAK
jgi:Transglutaminase-like enzymes, putative cysteine proteases